MFQKKILQMIKTTKLMYWKQNWRMCELESVY